MSTFNPDKLSVEYRDGVTITGPIFPRRYTLTHSDTTGNLFLTIGRDFAWDKIGGVRDEVLGQFRIIGSSIYFFVNIYLDQGEYNLSTTAKRLEIFKRELPLALTAIMHGDRFLFNKFPYLDHANIIINFMSSYPQFTGVENWGEFHRYIRKI